MAKYYFLFISLIISVANSNSSFSFVNSGKQDSSTDGMISVNFTTTTITTNSDGKITSKTISHDTYSSKLKVDNFYATLEEYKENVNVSKKIFALGGDLPTVIVADNDVKTFDQQGNETTYDGTKPVMKTDVSYSDNVEIYTLDPCAKTDNPALILTQKSSGSGTFHKASVSVKLFRENDPTDGFRMSVMTGGLPFQFGGDKIQGDASSVLGPVTNDNGETECKWVAQEPGYSQMPSNPKILDNVGSGSPDESAKRLGKRFYSIDNQDEKTDLHFAGIDTTEFFRYLKIHPTSQTFNMTGTYSKVLNNGDGKTEIKEECSVVFTIGLADKELEISGNDDEVYHKWIPIEKNNQDSKLFYAKAKLKTTDKVKEDTLYFLLSDVTTYKGICTNYPLFPENSPPKIGTESDLVFSKIQDDPNVIYIDSFNVKTNKKVSEAFVTIECKDFAAYGKLSVKTNTIKDCESKYDGKKYLAIPEDYNNNRIADAWEDLVGKRVDNINTDEDNFPANQKDTGDGLTFFEEYRGFQTKSDVSGDASKLIRNGEHVRTDPNYKDIFICDIDGYFKTFYAPDNAAKLNWHVVDDTQMKLESKTKIDSYIAQATYTEDGHLLASSFNDAHTYLNKMENRSINFNTSEANKITIQKGLYLTTKFNYDDDIVGSAICLEGTAKGIPSVEFVAITTRIKFTNRINKTFWNEDPNTHEINGINWGLQSEHLPLYTAAEIKLVDALQFKATIIHELGHALGIEHHVPDDSKGVTDCAMRYNINSYKYDAKPRKILLPNFRYCIDETYIDDAGQKQNSNNCFSQISVKCR